MIKELLKKLSNDEIGELYQLSKTECRMDPSEGICPKAFCLGGCNDSMMQECIESLRDDEE
jgi:hypothetical protein